MAEKDTLAKPQRPQRRILNCEFRRQKGIYIIMYTLYKAQTGGRWRRGIYIIMYTLYKAQTGEFGDGGAYI